jgi:hypothetical protein
VGGRDWERDRNRKGGPSESAREGESDGWKGGGETEGGVGGEGEAASDRKRERERGKEGEMERE